MQVMQVRIRKLLSLAAFAALVAGSAVVSLAQDGGGAAEPGARGPRHALRACGDGRRHLGHRRHGALHRMRARAARSESLALDDAQLRTVAEKSRAAQPAVAESRQALARIVVDARAAARAPDATRQSRVDAMRAARDQVRALRKSTAEKLAPLARDVIATLTPEQRGRLEGFAAARGRTLDEDRLVRRVSRRLARPMTADLAEARLGTR